MFNSHNQNLNPAQLEATRIPRCPKPGEADRLFAVRDSFISRLQAKGMIDEADLRTLDRTGKCIVANNHWNICTGDQSSLWPEEVVVAAPPLEAPDLESYDRIVVAFSGGKDSVACVLHLLNMGVPADQIHLHHHLVDGRESELMDWPITEGYCRAFAKAFGMQISFSWKVGGFEAEALRKDRPADQFKLISDYEKQFGYTIHRTLSVEELASSGTPHQIDPFWVELANSREFTIPVITDDWKLPPGAFGDSSCGAS